MLCIARGHIATVCSAVLLQQVGTWARTEGDQERGWRGVLQDGAAATAPFVRAQTRAVVSMYAQSHKTIPFLHSTALLPFVSGQAWPLP